MGDFSKESVISSRCPSGKALRLPCFVTHHSSVVILLFVLKNRRIPVSGHTTTNLHLAQVFPRNTLLSLVKMPFAVVPMLVPDISSVYDVYFEAFKNAQIMEFLFPGGIDRQAHKHGTTLWLHHDQNGYTIKCVDSDSGTVVGMAQYEIFWRPGKDTLWKKPKGAEWLKGDKRKKAETVLIPNWTMRDKLFGGRRHVCKSSIPIQSMYVC